MFRTYVFMLLIVILMGSSLCAKTSSSVISLAPNITEIIYFLGVQDKLAGVTTACNFPLEASRKEKVGEFGKVNVEKIVNLKPGLIITANFPDYLLAKLKPFKYQVLNYKMETIDELLSSMEDMAKKLGGNVSKVEELRQRVKGQVARGKDRPKVLVLIWDKPLMAAGGKSFLNEIISLAGGENVFSKIPQDYPKVTYEQIVAAKPDIVIFTHKTSNLEKFKNYKIYTNINPDILLRPGPRLITEGLEQLIRIIQTNQKPATKVAVPKK